MNESSRFRALLIHLQNVVRYLVGLRPAVSRRRCGDLLPFNRVFEQLKTYSYANLGVQAVPLSKIVGSFGHYRDFDLRFRPRNPWTETRLAQIARLSTKKPSPPVTLHKIGDAYFVEDGNHRVGVARSRGHSTVSAVVIDVSPAGLQPEPTCSRLGLELAPSPCAAN